MKDLHLPILIILGISVFCVSSSHSELAKAIQRYWTCAVIIVVCTISFFRQCQGRKLTLPKKKILKTFCFIGIVEILYVVLQLLGLVPDNYKYAYFSGTLNNPAVFGMLMSFCLPVSIHLAFKSIGRDVYLWRVMCILFALFVILSDSRTAFISSACGALSVCVLDKKDLLQPSYRKHIQILFLLFAIAICIGLYFYKRSSADGRILIWTVCIEMIKEKPLTGWGINGFEAKYMNYQADYFNRNPTSYFSMLADETQNPFNEFIHLAIIGGIPLASAFLCALIWVIRSFFLHKDNHSGVLVSLVLVLFIWCLFSYPLHVPFVWCIILFICILSFCSISYLPTLKIYCISISFIGVLCLFLYTKATFRDIHRIYLQERALRHLDESTIYEYERLHKEYTTDYFFLYNYGALLHHLGNYRKSLDVLRECSLYLADYNMLLIMGDDYQHLGVPDSALVCYKHASAMIPNRFLPLYYQMKTYQETGDEDNAIRIAKIIIHKPMKIPSSLVTAVKIESENFLESCGTDSAEVAFP